MRRRLVITCWLLWFLLAGALPAYANNPPTLDGTFGLILMFPVVIAAWRLAGVQPTAQDIKWRVANRVLLPLSILFCLLGVGDFLVYSALCGFLYILSYGIRRGIQVAQRGQGKKRLALGGAIILFTLFATSNYVMSVVHGSASPMAEQYAQSGLRKISTAEETFRSKATLDQHRNHAGEYGTLDQLLQAGLLKRDDLAHWYRFVVVVSGDPARDEKEFFAYASPVKYSYGEWSGWSFLPGGSWVAVLHPIRIARRTYAIDESGVIRLADLGTSRPVTREETRKWERLEP
jgi:hypothetical protein